MIASDTSAGSSPFTIVLAIAAVAGLWQLVSFLMSRKSKWHDYALRYAAPSRPEGTAYRVRLVSFGQKGRPCKYSYSDPRLIFTSQGVYFSMGFFWRHFHPPFLMPWNKVRRVEHYDGPFYQKYMLIIEEGADEIYVEMLGQCAADLKNFYKKPIGPGDPRLELDPQYRPY